MPRPLLALAALTLLLRAAPARADVPSGCATKDVTAAFGDFLRTGKMPPDTGRWLYDKKAQYIAFYSSADYWINNRQNMMHDQLEAFHRAIH